MVSGQVWYILQNDDDAIKSAGLPTFHRLALISIRQCHGMARLLQIVCGLPALKSWVVDSSLTSELCTVGPLLRPQGPSPPEDGSSRLAKPQPKNRGPGPGSGPRRAPHIIAGTTDEGACDTHAAGLRYWTCSAASPGTWTRTGTAVGTAVGQEERPTTDRAARGPRPQSRTKPRAP